MHHSTKANGDTSETMSDVCRSDTYIVLNVCKLRKEASFSHAVIISSFSSVGISGNEIEGSSCGKTLGLGISSLS